MPEPDAPGIPWEPGEEDYPFAARRGESALDYFQRWLETADYARLEHRGATYIHAVDVGNVLNHVTADVALLRARLDQFGDRVVTAADYAATLDHVERAMVELRETLAALNDDTRTER